MKLGAGAGIPDEDAKPASRFVGRASTTVSSSGLPSVSLPDTDEEVLTDPSKAIWLFYGAFKIGKSQVAHEFPKSLHLFFEPGGSAISDRKRFLPDWKHMKAYVVALQKDPGKFRTIIIDTVDQAYEKCLEYYCEKAGIETPSDEEWGAGWRAVKKEFQKVMDELVAMDLGIIFISHATEKKFSKKDGREYDKIVPTMGKQARAVAAASSDVIAYFSYWEKQRMMEIGGHDQLDAGIRLKKNFWVKQPEDYDGKPRRVQAVPMGDNEEEAYANLMIAWNNEQEKAFDEAHVPTLPEYASKRKGR